MAGRRINIALNRGQESFIKWLAKRDGLTEQEELQNIFYTELSELMSLDTMIEDYERETGKPLKNDE